MSDPVMINVVTIAAGCFSPVEGIADLGTKKEIPVELFSSNWMKPTDQRSATAIKKHLEAKATSKE